MYTYEVNTHLHKQELTRCRFKIQMRVINLLTAALKYYCIPGSTAFNLSYGH